MMFRKRNRRKVPGLNTTSTADISFMLLILFLVSSSMDLDQGIARQLPPIDKDREKQTEAMVNSRQLMKFQISKDNKVLLNGKDFKIGSVRAAVEKFVSSNGKGHIIQLQADRKSSYNTYFEVQNEIMAAYSALRNHRSMEEFGKAYDLCSVEQQQKISDEIPVRISEVYEIQAQENEGGGEQ
ncbi:ExbD/TolR family protein [Prevotella dentasini]|uniref:ExbD/TolR family protein n=1 Tax=Prevotella dentasini TaxID=589537 RepID=UPI000468F57F|nr:biopolymer transporter ExbD [Prevotella dentasini]